jgi:F-type H+-transporting ATPase subunit b
MHIDLWTLGLQAINAIVLIWLLARFLFRPVTAIIAARRQAADALLAEAAAMRAKAQAEAAELAKQRAGIGSEADRRLADARSAAEAERTLLREQGEREAANARSEAQTAIARERDTMQHGLDARAGELAITIARRLLQPLPAAAITTAMLHALVEKIAAMPEAERNRLASPGAMAQIVTAASLDEAEQAACRVMLSNVLGEPTDLQFSVDPTLIAGIELRLPHALIRNSWRADLERIQQELCSDDSHDTRSRRVA